MTETPNPHIVDTDTLTGEMHPIRRAVLALGSNLGERMASLQGAVDSLADTPDVWVTGVSSVYETDPVDMPSDSKQFLNAVVTIDTTLPAATLLDRALAIEDAFDRVRPVERNMPRTLDVDLIVVGDRRSDDDFLKLPHPRARERAFVLMPWLELEPDAVLPDAGRGRRPARRGRPERRQAPRRPGARAPVARVSEQPPGDDDARLRPTGAGLLLGWGLAGLVGGWLVRPALGLGRRHRADGHLAAGARAVPGRRDPRRHGLGHLAHPARARAPARAAPRGQPAGAGQGVRPRGRPGGRRVRRLRAELGGDGEPSWPTSGWCAPASPHWAAC